MGRRIARGEPMRSSGRTGLAVAMYDRSAWPPRSTETLGHPVPRDCGVDAAEVSSELPDGQEPVTRAHLSWRDLQGRGQVSRLLHGLGLVRRIEKAADDGDGADGLEYAVDREEHLVRVLPVARSLGRTSRAL